MVAPLLIPEQLSSELTVTKLTGVPEEAQVGLLRLFQGLIKHHLLRR